MEFRFASRHLGRRRRTSELLECRDGARGPPLREGPKALFGLRFIFVHHHHLSIRHAACVLAATSGARGGVRDAPRRLRLSRAPPLLSASSAPPLGLGPTLTRPAYRARRLVLGAARGPQPVTSQSLPSMASGAPTTESLTRSRASSTAMPAPREETATSTSGTPGLGGPTPGSSMAK